MHINIGHLLWLITLGVEVKFRNAFYEVLIFPSYVRELNCLEVTDQGLVVGGAVTLSLLHSKLGELVRMLPSKFFCTMHKSAVQMSYVRLAQRTGVFSAILEMLRWFAGQQIRNVAVSDVEYIIIIIIVVCCRR